MSGPIPGMIASLWLVGLALCQAVIRTSIDPILRVYRVQRRCHEAEDFARQVRYGPIRAHALQKASDMRGPLSLNQTELRQMPTQSVDQLSSLPHEEVAGAMHHKHGLLLLALNWHEAHGGARHGLANCRSVCRIVLAALEISFDVLGRDKPDVVTQPAQLPRPEMGRGTGLQTNPAGWKLGK